MSNRIVVKLVIDSSVDLRQEWDSMLSAASIQEITEDGHSYFAWTDHDWSTLSHADLIPLDEWMDRETEQLDRPSLFQYICLVKDDTYLTTLGNIEYGLEVQFV